MLQIVIANESWSLTTIPNTNRIHSMHANIILIPHVTKIYEISQRIEVEVDEDYEVEGVTQCLIIAIGGVDVLPSRSIPSNPVKQ